MHIQNNSNPHPQIKICGLTRPQEALACAAAGAHAIGLVFYPKSPRHVADDQARDITRALPPEIARVGVFVNASFDDIMKKADRCGLNAVQLHGQESPDLVEQLAGEDLLVIKALFHKHAPGFKEASAYRASAFLVEYGKGKLPGGNARSWDWGAARELTGSFPLILAGGISEENVVRAIEQCLPDAVDISSGVESSPGRKDISKVESFISKVNTAQFEQKNYDRKLRRIFNAKP